VAAHPEFELQSLTATEEGGSFLLPSLRLFSKSLFLVTEQFGTLSGCWLTGLDEWWKLTMIPLLRSSHQPKMVGLGRTVTFQKRDVKVLTPNASKYGFIQK
jgi:hypothetical protein